MFQYTSLKLKLKVAPDSLTDTSKSASPAKTSIGNVLNSVSICPVSELVSDCLCISKSGSSGQTLLPTYFVYNGPKLRIFIQKHLPNEVFVGKCFFPSSTQTDRQIVIKILKMKLFNEKAKALTVN